MTELLALLIGSVFSLRDVAILLNWFPAWRWPLGCRCAAVHPFEHPLIRFGSHLSVQHLQALAQFLREAVPGLGADSCLIGNRGVSENDETTW